MRKQTVGRLIRLRQQTHPSGFPSMSRDSRQLHSVKRQVALASSQYPIGKMPMQRINAILHL
jgi:hypothetical protein